MARLPLPGGDAGNWGDILNEFLLVEHNTDGTLTDVVRQATILPASLTFVIDGGGAVITAGQSVELTIPFAATVTGWTVLADLSGTITTTVNRASYAAYPTFSEISGTVKPGTSAASKGQSSSLAGWTTALAAGDIIQVAVGSADTATKLTIAVEVERIL